MKKKIIKMIVYIIFFVLAILLFYKTFVPLAPELWQALKSGDEEQIELFLNQSGKWRGLIYLFLLQAIQVVSIVLPGAPIEIAGGMAYGFIRSFFVCHISFVTANILIFALSRRFRTDFLDNAKVDKALEMLNRGDPFVTIILCFMVPIVPNGIIPYAASATKISALKYAVGVYLGSSVQMIMMCAVGRYILSRDYFYIAVLFILDFIAMLIIYKKRDNLNTLADSIADKIKAKR